MEGDATGDDGLHATVLAAGGSRRLGRAKQLVRFRGATLLERAVGLARAVCGARTRVVIGAEAARMRALLGGQPVRVLTNADWRTGMAGSLRMAVESLPPTSAGLLVLVCDQPLLEPRHLRALRDAWTASRTSVVASRYAGTLGVPAILPARLFGALLSLPGDSGARRVIRAEGDAAIGVDVPEAAFDMDDAAALDELARVERDDDGD